MIELIFIIGTASLGVLLFGIGSIMWWSYNDIIGVLGYGIKGLGGGVVFYAVLWLIRWLLLGGLVA